MQRKYVILVDAHPESHQASEFPVLIDNRIAHRSVHQWARENDTGYRHGVRTYTKPVSAGFFSIVDGKVQVGGYSETLDLHSRPEDADIISKFLFGA
jgi:hypothetical protein